MRGDNKKERENSPASIGYLCFQFALGYPAYPICQTMSGGLSSYGCGCVQSHCLGVLHVHVAAAADVLAAEIPVGY